MATEALIGQLTGKVALVSGGAGGIGSAICRKLASYGCHVVIGYGSNEGAALELQEGLPTGNHLRLQLRVDDSQSCEQALAAIARHYGHLDILVNNAGVTKFVAHDDLAGLDDELFDHIFRVNVRGAFALCRAAKDLLEASGDATIVNISSIAGRTGNGSNVAYCASKAAMDSMTRSLARALAPKIRVLSVAPGLVEGKYTERLEPRWIQAQRDGTPLKRLAQAEDVANAVYAAVGLLRFSTGDVIPVDGGRPIA